jgi:hypothetical protein
MAMALVLVAGAVLLTACGSQEDAEPTVASVDFEPRLVITVDEGGITGGAGPREGVEELSDDDGDWRLPSGSVTDLTNEAPDARRVVVTVTPLEGTDDDPAPWLDTGLMEPGEATVIALTSPGVYRFDDAEDGDPDTAELVVQVVPRSSS